MRLAGGVEATLLRGGNATDIVLSTTGLARWHPGEGPWGFGAGLEVGVWEQRQESDALLSSAATGAGTSSASSRIEDPPFIAPVLVPMHLELAVHRIELRGALVCSGYEFYERTLVGDDLESVRRDAFGPTALTFGLSWNLAIPVVKRTPPSR